MSGIEEFTSEFFDDASKAWRANKICLKDATYRYRKNAFPVEKPLLEKPVTVKTVVAKTVIKHSVPRRSPRIAMRH